jgi:hypothetical protein
MRVDPDRRLVADSLEADWNRKLCTLQEAQQQYERQREKDRRRASSGGLRWSGRNGDPTRIESSVPPHCPIPATTPRNFDSCAGVRPPNRISIMAFLSNCTSPPLAITLESYARRLRQSYRATRVLEPLAPEAVHYQSGMSACGVSRVPISGGIRWSPTRISAKSRSCCAGGPAAKAR